MPRGNPEGRKMYHTPEWRRLRKIVLTTGSPLCVRCNLSLATVVDHKRPHRFDPALFFDLNNLQKMCARCHDTFKKNMEFGKVDTACDEDGFPMDENHPWLSG